MAVEPVRAEQRHGVDVDRLAPELLQAKRGREVLPAPPLFWRMRSPYRGRGRRGYRIVMNRFDAIVIGAGQAGPSLTGRLTAAGMTVAVVERNLVGGTCVNTGCTPTKTLVASAQAAYTARGAADYGVVLIGWLHGTLVLADRRSGHTLRLD